MSILLLIVRYFLCLVFMLSSSTKVIAPGKFVSSVQKYRILPSPLAKLYAHFLIYFELLLAVSLFFGWLPTVTGLVTALVLLSFMTAISIIMVRKQVLECGCFGLLYREKIRLSTLGRDSVLLFMALAIAIWGNLASNLTSILNSGSLSERFISLVFLALILPVLFTTLRNVINTKLKRRYLIRAQRQLTVWTEKQA
jgi:uncharacterized membrane protein YphA (DoxX/SURF4 family)